MLAADATIPGAFMRRLVRLPVLAALLAAALAAPLPALAGQITVFAAASLGDALREAAESWQAETGHRAVISPAGSSALARQIAQGAPADLFLSANADWMDWLAERDLIRPETRRILMRNALVLVAPAAAEATEAAPAELGPGTDLSAWLPADGRLAMALVEAVPAGIYGRQALEALGLWDGVAARVAQTDNVRAALRLVALGEAALGVVYATDAAAEPRVRVVAGIPARSHDPIVYPGAVTRDAAAPELAAAFLDWLAGAPGQALLARHGFRPADG
ncbi:molybdate ABC transporter substrate-binding protein [Roseivivax sp. CAU 1761]